MSAYDKEPASCLHSESLPNYETVNVSSEKIKTAPGRNSNIELLRIVAMLVIVAHHYVVNSGLIDLIGAAPSLTRNSIFLLLFGSLGKTAINCFLLISGYFMCTQKMTLKKFLKLFLEVEFYKIVINLLFILFGYHFTYKALFMKFTPFYGIGRGFVPSIVPFFLFIPFLNVLIHAMDKKMHLKLIMLCLFIFTIIPSFTVPPFLVNAEVCLGDLGWFSVVYLLAAYIRLYPENWFQRKNLWRISAAVSLMLSFASIIVMAHIIRSFGMKSVYYPYFFISPSSKILALTTSVCVFMSFISMDAFYSKIINKVAAAVFGVLLIHANGSTMRHWLWKDLLKNVKYINADFSTLLLHALCCVVGIYVICTIIDMMRIEFIEKPFFKWFDKHMTNARQA